MRRLGEINTCGSEGNTVTEEVAFMHQILRFQVSGFEMIDRTLKLRVVICY